ncbi:uncharacterized protein LOC143294834 [Babylonia areolata]|uniref:uncharacterized protein LOC143294834 n=1 Tax=Babylonia areolata TaxID=304850 RepID=UPI003FD20FBE
MEGVEEGSESPVSHAVSGDYYYMKALSYLASSAESSSEDMHCSCLHYPPAQGKLDEDHFSTGFRPGLTLDDHHGFGACSEVSSLSQYSSSAPSSSGHLRDHKDGTGSKGGLKTGSNDASGKHHLKRRMSDGHVHWADEFQKDLTRCRPRKSYTRHPSLHVPHIKPILKANPEDGDPN